VTRCRAIRDNGLVRAFLLIVTLTLVGPDAAPAQVLGIEGTRFTIDGAAKFLVLISYFDGLHRAASGPAALDHDFDFLRQHVDGIRVLVNWCGHPCLAGGQTGAADPLFDREGRIREETWVRFKTLLDRARAHRLIVDVTFTRETLRADAVPPLAAYGDGIKAVIARLEREAPGSYRHVFFDIQNEFTIRDGFTDDQVDAIVAKAREARPSAIVTGSITQKTAAEAAAIVKRRKFSIAAFHDARSAGSVKHWHERARLLEDVRALIETGVPVVYDEPTAYCVASADRRCHPAGIDDSNVSHFVEAAKQAKQAGAALWTFHTRAAFDLSNGGYVDRASNAEKELLAAIGSATR
jgi:hypothetical protein